MKVGNRSCSYEVLTNSCCPQVRHQHLYLFGLPGGRRKLPGRGEKRGRWGFWGRFNLGERGSGVALGLVSRIRVGRRDRWLGRVRVWSFVGLGRRALGKEGLRGLTGQEGDTLLVPFFFRREHPVGSSPLPRRGLLYIYIFVYILIIRYNFKAPFLSSYRIAACLSPRSR